MDLTRELLLPYQGLNGLDGLCHIRIYEQPGQLPIVLAGALDDNPGTPITHSITMLAASIQHSQFPDGREFRLIEHHPNTLDGRGIHTYALVHFEHRAVDERPLDATHHPGAVVVLGEDTATATATATAATSVSRGAAIDGDFREPRWEPVQDIEELLGCAVAVWAPGRYTAGTVGGDEGERLRSLLAENANRVGELAIAELG
jgi:hypothetical protein